MSEFWILRSFGPLFFALLAFFILLLVVASLLVKGKSERTKVLVICITCWVTLIGFFFYKYALSLDEEFALLTADMGGFNWWGELPLQLCNINLIIIPIAVLTKKRPLLSFCFFVGPLGAFMAIMMPSMGFDGYSFFLPRMLGFYITHYVVMIASLAIGTFGLYRPKWSDLPRMGLALLVIGFIVFCFNLVLRYTGLHPKANYFFSVETEGNPLLEFFYRFLPYPFLYLIPNLLVLWGYAVPIVLGYQIADSIKKKKAQNTLSYE